MRTPAGGWPYYRGREARIEPTCWSLLALSSSADPTAVLEFLSSRHLQPTGLLTDLNSPEPNSGWTGLAMLAARQVEGGAALHARLLPAVVAAKGVQLRPEATVAIPQDGMLQAWSWTPGTFSWVEPTAYCLLALKQVEERTPAIEARITEAEAVLADRVCPVGGWNYGNSAVLGQDLRPYVSTTALGLLAMADRPNEPSVARSLDWLEAHATTERATMALALTALALTIHGRPAAAALADLAALGDETAYLDNAHLIAMALYALTIPDHDARAFRIPATRSALQSEQ
jgi:hypothetical protein